jgi:hypothetical protein
MSRPRHYPSLRLLLIVTLGITAAWGFLVVLGVAQWETSTLRRRTVESLAIRIDGEPLINRYRFDGTYEQLPYRTLDGEEVSTRAQLAPSAPFFDDRDERPWSSGPITWLERLQSTNYAGPWYVIRDDAVEGRAYLASFDEHSRLPIDYVGRDGFGASPPPREQQFDVGLAFAYGSNRVAGVALRGTYYAGTRVAGEYSASTPSYCLYVLDNDNLFEINLRNRSLRKLATIPGSISLRIMEVPQAIAGVDAEKQEQIQEAAEEHSFVPEIARASRLVVRTADSLLIVDPKVEERIEVALPDALQGKSFTAYALSDQRFLLQRTTRKPGEAISHLTWIDAAGAVQRTADVSIREPEQSVVVGAFIAALLTAAPLAFGVFMFLFAPLKMTGTTYVGAILQLLGDIWPIALVLVLASLAGAYFVYRWHRENDRPHPLRWAIATFLLGVPGLIAYLLLHDRPSASHARRVPLPTLTLTGTEIFA